MSAAYDSVPYEVATAILAPVSSGELVIDLELDVEPDEEVFVERRRAPEPPKSGVKSLASQRAKGVSRTRRKRPA